jgi:hypothetical protein
MNKLGEKVLSIWMFGIWIIVGLAVVGGVFVFFNQNFDVRNIEANILNDKMKECLKQGEVLESLEGGDFELGQCRIEEGFFQEESNYFIKIVFEGKEFKFGNFGFEKDCEIGEGLLKARNFPSCVEKIFFVEGKEVKLLTASNAEGGKYV